MPCTATATNHTAPAKTKAPATVLAVAVSAKVRALIDHIRTDFDAFTASHALLQADRASLAPRFMKALGAWQTETGSTFAAFVRLLYSTVPEDRDGYRAHATYQAADYLRRLQAQAGAKKETELPEDERPVSIYQALAYLVATVMPAVDPTGAIWSAFVKEMHWNDDQSNRIKVMAAKVGAVKLPPTVKHRLAHVA